MICFKNEGQREIVRFLAVNFRKMAWNYDGDSGYVK